MNAKYPADQGRSYRELERVARGIRRSLGFDLTGELPGEALFGSLSNYTVTCDDREIRLDYEVANLEPGIEAEARYEQKRDRLVICLTPDTYEGLEKNQPRSRFSLFHEIGHPVLHVKELIRLSRIPRHTAALHRGQYGNLPPYLDCEWQANGFAAALAMPAAGLEMLAREGRLSVTEIMNSFRVSRASAEIRLSVFEKRKSDLLNLK